MKYKTVNPYDIGGILSTIGGAASNIPGVGGLVGGGFGLAGNLISRNKQKKEEEKLRKQQELDIKQAQLSQVTASGGMVNNVVNPYMLAFGGLADSKLETYDNGGLHSQNPMGGIPLNQGSNGRTNVVEEGEASFNFEDGKYIFSNRLTL